MVGLAALQNYSAAVHCSLLDFQIPLGRAKVESLLLHKITSDLTPPEIETKVEGGVERSRGREMIDGGKEKVGIHPDCMVLD